jgi:hypothetical protein
MTMTATFASFLRAQRGRRATALTQAEYNDAFDEGREAQRAGKPSSSNPHSGDEGEAWSAGWNYSDKDKRYVDPNDPRG